MSGYGRQRLPVGIDYVVASHERAIRFGPFCLWPAAHLLLEHDTPVHIGVRALDLLIVLVERDRDEHPPSATEYPFLAPPDPERVDH